MGMRPYQQRAIDALTANWNRGVTKNLLKLATGAGKTHIFSEVMKRTAEAGHRCGMMVRGVHLIEQASRRLAHEGVPHGVVQGNHWNKNFKANIQLCSIDTLTRRPPLKDIKLWVIDEAHLFTSDKCVEYIDRCSFDGAYIFGVTATPYVDKPLTHIAQEVIAPITMQELIDEKYLMPFTYFSPSIPDLKGVRTQNGDYAADQLEQRMDSLTGDIVKHWRNLGENRPTVAFASNISHSKKIVAAFNSAGIPAVHIDADHTIEEREFYIAQLCAGVIKILSNCGVLCTGVDIPALSCLILARPTKSYNLYVQQLGRGTRPFPGKHDCRILDHAGNTLRHGFATFEPDVFLDGRAVFSNGPRAQRCPECYVSFTGESCHACGWTPPPPPPILERTIEEDDGILEQLKGLPLAAEVSIFIKRTKRATKGCNKEYLHFKVREKYGQEIADQAFPNTYKKPWFLDRQKAVWRR